MSSVERTGLKVLLGTTALAWAALSTPGLVVVGLFMLILPGLILMASPTIALYGWLFAIPYFVFRQRGSSVTRAAATALLVPLAIGFGPPVLSNTVTSANLAAAVATDVRPAQPLPIGGTVALVRDGQTGGWHADDDGCDDLCLRLLYNGTAKVVYLGQLGRQGLAFAIQRRPVCPPFILSQDVLKWHEWPRRASDEKGVNWPLPPGLKEVVEARIAGGECLTRVGGTIRPDWTIARLALARDTRDDPWSAAPANPQGEQITVYRRDGSAMNIVGRYTNAYAPLLTLPLVPALDGAFGSERWKWSRTMRGESRWDWDSVSALRKLVVFNTDIPDGMTPLRMRELLANALADPRRQTDDAGLLLANSVMVDIARNGAQPGDAALLAKAVADDRFTKIEPRYEIAAKLGADYAMIANSAVARLGRLPASNESSFPYNTLNSIISGMPPSWFAPPPPSLTDLLRNPVIAARAEGIIYKLDAGGAAAVPLLTQIVTRGAERVSAVEQEGYARHSMSGGINAAVGALCRIGPPARSALGAIVAAKLKLIGPQNASPETNPGKYNALWRGRKVNTGFVVTLVSLGTPLTEFRAPDQPSSTVNGTWQGMILLGVKNHDCTL